MINTVFLCISKNNILLLNNKFTSYEKFITKHYYVDCIHLGYGHVYLRYSRLCIINLK